MSKPLPEQVTITVDAGQWVGELPHNWTYIGYDEINYTYTPEGQELLAKFGQMQEQPYYVRAHHLLCTGNCRGFYKWGSTNAYLEDEAGNPLYDWTFVDLTLDTILQYGCKPFVELGFMPLHLADTAYHPTGQASWTPRDYQAVGFACPPKDYQRWYDLIFHLVLDDLDGDDCMITCGGQSRRTSRRGDWVLFDYSQPHSSFNRTTRSRINIILDFTPDQCVLDRLDSVAVKSPGVVS